MKEVKMDVIEVLARAWIECDPNREKNTDEPIPQMMEAGSDGKGNSWSRLLPPTKLTGKPRWHWFVPRAEATKEFLEKNGFEIVEKSHAS